MYDVEKNLTNHSPKNENVIYDMEQLRQDAKVLARTISDLCPLSREQSLAFTNLEQTVMWAIAAIARNQ